MSLNVNRNTGIQTLNKAEQPVQEQKATPQSTTKEKSSLSTSDTWNTAKKIGKSGLATAIGTGGFIMSMGMEGFAATFGGPQASGLHAATEVTAKWATSNAVQIGMMIAPAAAAVLAAETLTTTGEGGLLLVV